MLQVVLAEMSYRILLPEKARTGQTNSSSATASIGSSAASSSAASSSRNVTLHGHRQMRASNAASVDARASSGALGGVEVRAEALLIVLTTHVNGLTAQTPPYLGVVSDGLLPQWYMNEDIWDFLVCSCVRGIVDFV